MEWAIHNDGSIAFRYTGNWELIDLASVQLASLTLQWWESLIAQIHAVLASSEDYVGLVADIQSALLDYLRSSVPNSFIYPN